MTSKKSEVFLFSFDNVDLVPCSYDYYCQIYYVSKTINEILYFIRFKELTYGSHCVRKYGLPKLTKILKHSTVPYKSKENEFSMRL